MLTVFNRRELITLSSQQTFFRVREALSAAGMASKVNFHGTARAAQRARYGSAGLRQDAICTPIRFTSTGTTMTGPDWPSSLPCGTIER